MKMFQMVSGAITWTRRTTKMTGKNFLNECFDCEAWFNGFTKKELAGIVVKAILAGAFLFSVLVVFVAALG